LSYNPTLLLPTNDADFETLCCHIAREKYQDNDAQKYGRRGQKQWGVDIKAIDRRVPGGQPLVIQCKFKKDNAKNQLEQIKKELMSELSQALDSHLSFNKFIYAYTCATDNNLDDFADQLSQEHGVEVLIWSIDDIIQDIEYYPRLNRLYSKGTSKLDVSVINKDFIDDLRVAEQTDIDVFRFYSGYSGNDEQWLGILNNLDAPRRQAAAIKGQCDMLMARKTLEARVAAVVYGGGGSGKSTLLRRLAIDNVLEGKPYVNWWIKDIDAFLEFDAHCITDTKNQQHMVFVEDWYRTVTSDQGRSLLAWLKQQSNVLVLVGDRTNTGKYRNSLYDNYCQQLQASDNNEIVSHIFSIEALGRHQSLRPIIEEVKSLPKLLEKVPISMVLFVIAWQYQNESMDEAFGIKEGFDNAFKKIIYGLLKTLESSEKYRGLGKALHLAARIYSSPNSSYFALLESTFINIADSLGNNDNQLAKRMEYQSNYPSQLDCLVHKSTIMTSLNVEINRIQFNHDVIAEQGIALIEDDDFVLGSFEQHQLLSNLIEKKQADGALWLWQLWAANDKQNVSEFEFEALLEITSLDDVLLHSSRVLIHIIKTRLSVEHKHRICRHLLALPEFYKLHPGAISTALNLVKDQPEGIIAAKTILALTEFYKLSFEIISTALTLLRNQPEGVTAAKTILALPEFYQLPKEIISTALNLLQNQPEGVSAAKKIVALPEFYRLPFETISTALKLLTDHPDGISAAKKIVALPEFYKLPVETISTALKLLTDCPEGIAAAKVILLLPEFYLLPNQIISTALKLLTHHPEGIAAAKAILALPEFYLLPHQTISSALKMLKDTPEGWQASRVIIDRGITKQTFLLFAAIRSLCLSTNDADINLVGNIYREIYLTYKKKNNPGVARLWNDLFWQPLMGIKKHKQRVSATIENYKFDNSYFAKLNLFKILKCYTVDYPKKNHLAIKMNRVQQSIVFYSVNDIKHQIEQNGSRLLLGHIDIAMQNTPQSDIKYQQAKEVAALAKTNSILENHQLHETVLAILASK